jgi:hypothetical protein
MDNYPTYSATSVSRPKKGSIFWGATVMFIGGLILAWIPFFGGLIAGIVGGKIAGTTRNAVIAAIIPAIVVSLGGLLLVLVHPLLIFVGIFGFLVALFHLLGVLIGAVIGSNL